jgi:hypothetical protein
MLPALFPLFDSGWLGLVGSMPQLPIRPPCLTTPSERDTDRWRDGTAGERCEARSCDCTQSGSSCKTWSNTAKACKGMLRMGCIDTASLAYEQSVLSTVPASAREHSNLRDSITNWCVALVCRPNPAGLPPAPKALADARPNGWPGFQARLSHRGPDDSPVKTGCECNRDFAPMMRCR